MRIAKMLVALGATAIIFAGAATSASADWYHRERPGWSHRGGYYHDGYYRGGYYHGGPGPVLGLVGGVIVGAATIATLPFAILGAAVSPAPPPPPRYYGPAENDYYPPPPPPPRYRGYYGPPPGYYGY